MAPKTAKPAAAAAAAKPKAAAAASPASKAAAPPAKAKAAAAPASKAAAPPTKAKAAAPPAKAKAAAPPSKAAKAAAPAAAAPAKGSKAAAAPAKGAAAAAPAARKATAPAPAKGAAAAKSAPKPAAAAKTAKAAPAHNGVYVKNWGTGSVADATEVFKAAGNVQKAQIRRHRYALIFFDSPAAVKRAIDLFHEKEVLGTVVTVVPAKASPKPDPHEGSSCVFVSPIFRTSTTKQQILELFKGMKVLRLRTYRTNYAYVYLDSPAAAKRFVEEKNGTEFRGHKLRVALSTRSLEKLRARQNAAKLLMAAHRHKKTTQAH